VRKVLNANYPDEESKQSSDERSWSWNFLKRSKPNKI
jgi:hypothetical protein